MKAMKELTVIEQEGQRVLTTAQLAEFYGTDVNRIYDNFNRNKERYKKGKHHFCLEGETLQAFKYNPGNCVVAQNINKLYLWTEKGALLHAKSLNTDQAWDVYEKLVDDYFRVITMLPGGSNTGLPGSSNRQILQLTGQVEQYREYVEAYSDQKRAGFPDHKPDYMTEKEACKIYGKPNMFFRSELVWYGYLELKYGVLQITEKGRNYGEVLAKWEVMCNG